MSSRNKWVPEPLLKAAMGMPHAVPQTTGVLVSKMQLLWIAALLLVSWFAPSTWQLMQKADAIIAQRDVAAQPTALRWTATLSWALFSALLLTGSLLGMARVSEFLYFQF